MSRAGRASADTASSSSTATDEKGEARGRRIGILTYVLCYDDLTRGDAARLPALGADVLELRIGRRQGIRRAPSTTTASTPRPSWGLRASATPTSPMRLLTTTASA